MSDTKVTLQRGGVELIPRVEPLWNLLFDHHLSIGAAGLATISRGQSWPLRAAHYSRLFAEQPRTSIWLATQGASVLGYAFSFVCSFEERQAAVLETLSVDPSARGSGVGSLLMDAVDREALDEGNAVGIVDVMAGNPRARELYLRRGYAPHSETWMRSVAGDAQPQRSDASRLLALAAEAEVLGFVLELSPGPDDTWVSAEIIADLCPAKVDGSTDCGDPRPEQLDALFAELAAAGFWTVRLEIAAAPSATELRAMLGDRGFKPSTERLVRRSPRS